MTCFQTAWELENTPGRWKFANSEVVSLVRRPVDGERAKQQHLQLLQKTWGESG
jgi:hypothetical protein